MSHVLVVEDQEPMRRLLRKWVEAEGASVLEAETAEEGLSLATRGEPAAVALCDLRLPGRNGLWLADQLRVAAPHTSVVMTTGVHEFDAAVKSLQSGVVDYVAKPFSRERLVAALHRAFAAHTARRAVAVMEQELEQDRARAAEALGEVEVTSVGSIEAMLAIMESRKAGAAHAARRVARLSVNLALGLDVREPALSDVEHAALLYDLGTVLLPEAAIAVGDDSEDARVLVRQGLARARAVLKNVPFLSTTTDLVLASRERYDGRGVPAGLRGDAIPLGARIISVAAAFDALVHAADRPRAPSAAVLELEARRAGEVDPRVIEVLRALSEPVPSQAA